MPSAKVRGGIHQRKRRRTKRNVDAAPVAVLTSKSGIYFQQKLAWGEFSPQEVQRLASLITADIKAAIGSSAEFPDLDFFSKIGISGRRPQHCHMDLFTSLSVENSLKPTMVTVPICNLTGERISTADVPIFQPHETMSTLHDHHPEVFKQRVVQSPEALHRFWDDMEDHPQLTDHLVRLRRDWKRPAISLCLHGDGVPLTGIGKSWSKFMDVFSISSVMGEGSTRQRMFLLWSFFHCSIIGRHCFAKFSFHKTYTVVVVGMERATSNTRR